MDIDKVLSHFKGVVQTSPKTWKALCPAHKDKNPSLSITLEPKRILMYCQAGCNFEEIIASVSLTHADLRDGKQGSMKAIAATYNYFNDKGKLIYQVCRTEGKDFFQRRPGPDGKWIPNLKGIDSTLYKLPELMAAKGARAVFVCEGEKDVDRLTTLGFAATCNSGGAGKWYNRHTPYMKGKQAIILQDNDEPGKKHAEAVAAKLTGTAASIRILKLDDLKEHGDVSDWLNAGHTAEDLREAVKKTSPIGEESETAPEGIEGTDLVNLDLPPIKYIIPDLIPEGLTLLVGRPKIGKSWLCLDLAIAVASGGYALSTIKVDPHEVLYLALEDNLRRLKKRLIKLLDEGTMPKGVTFFLQWDRLDDVSGGLKKLRAWIRAHPGCGLIVIDTLAKVKAVAQSGTSSYDADTQALNDIQHVAGENGIGIILVHHTRKAEVEDELDAVSGTLALPGVADTTLILKKGKGRAKGELYVVGRDIQEQHLAVTWGEETATWAIIGDAEQVELSEGHRKILEVLDNNEGTMSPKEIQAATGMQRSTLDKLLKRMIEKSEISRPDRGQYTSYKKPASGRLIEDP